MERTGLYPQLISNDLPQTPPGEHVLGRENCIHPLWGQVRVTGSGHADLNRPMGEGVVSGASADIEWPLRGAVVWV